MDSDRPSFLDINRLLDYRLIVKRGQGRSRTGWKEKEGKGRKALVEKKKKTKTRKK